MKRISALGLALVMLTLLCGADGGGCESSKVGDPTFDLWCGDELCGWTRQQGQIERVPTWHRSDYGVSLVGSAVTLYQDIDIDSYSTKCLEFRLQADHDDKVNLLLEIDFDGDGSADSSQPLASDNFEDVSYRIRPPLYYNGARIILRKVGAGRAVLAEVKAKGVNEEECANLQPVALVRQKLGASCDGVNTCASGRCVKVQQWTDPTLDLSLFKIFAPSGDTCSGCELDAHCSGGQVCGIDVAAKGLLHRACVDKASHAMGQRCATDGECKSGVCCEGRCSECCASAAPCAGNGNACQAQSSWSPYRCANQRQSGAPCVADHECGAGSGKCSGTRTLKVCSYDGRTCDSDDDCMYFTETCKTVGIVDGTCD